MGRKIEVTLLLVLIIFVGQCKAEIPLVIMTSDDTHSPTVDLLESNNYFGMKSTQVTLLKQAIPASLGVSATKGYHVNSLAVPRKAKEAIGGITKLTHTDGNSIPYVH
ncbi:hypothetical protein GW17_00031866 [Ensete ventricosum]|nr:hypothetical protein GW17_00031866 [Ensete ventricosum]